MVFLELVGLLLFLTGSFVTWRGTRARQVRAERDRQLLDAWRDRQEEYHLALTLYEIEKWRAGESAWASKP